MTVRLICALAVVLGCGYVGIVKASVFETRVVQIREFSEILRYLEVEIALSGTVLCEAMRAAAGRRGGIAADMFLEAADKLEASGGTDTREVWLGVIEEYSESLCVGGDVIETLRDFSALLGGGTRKSEADNIKAAREKLKLAEEEALRRKAGSFNLYRSLGFACGILITVLLL